MPTFVGLFRKVSRWTIVALLALGSHPYSYADDASATLSLAITDASGAVIQGATIVIHNVSTNQEQRATSSKAGDVIFSFLRPGHYSLLVSKHSFSDVAVDNINLNVGDEKHLQLVLKVGSAQQIVTVDGSGLTVNTIDGSVSTVIDSKFVENMPLNGRSFQDLILLAPGIVPNNPQQTNSGFGVTGEFSVNGQRTESNSYMVDGVSANIGASNVNSGAAPSGSLPAATALGTTQALVSVDALQEFRVESSTYSAEYGRNPGGQFAMVTRSGTNQWHGSAFDYFRNDALDANNWFNDNTVPITAKTAERQNDFGGTLSGPVTVPLLYNGKNRTFFFFSYEGLRLVQPQDVTINAVPDLALRQSAPAPLNQVLNAFPLPTPNTPDLGDGVAEFVGGWSTPSQLDSVSVRLDQLVGENTRVFFRYSQAPSSSTTRGNSIFSGGLETSPSIVNTNSYVPRTYTLGLTSSFPGNLTNDLRMNLSTNVAHYANTPDSFGGAQAVDLAQLQGLDPTSASAVDVSFFLGAYALGIYQGRSLGSQRQWNLVDSLSASRGRHNLKFGIDWRRLTPTINPGLFAYYEFDSDASVTANSVDYGDGESSSIYYPLYTNFSAFLQDEWRATSRLSLSFGLRWDVNPAPGVTSGLPPYTVTSLNDLSQLELAPAGTSLWKTAWFNLAPRLGFAYVANSQTGHELVLRGGGGVFFDTGQQTGSFGFSGPGFGAYNYFGTDNGTAASFPVAPSAVNPPIVSPPTAPYSAPIYANPQHLQLPYTYQWNGSVEQQFGESQSLTISYVGANGRKLLELANISASQINPQLGTSLYIYQNGLTSSYNSLQVKGQRQISHGLQTLISYTWSHALDFGSYNYAYPYQRGNSAQDVRHNLSGAVSYDLPSVGKSLLLEMFLNRWGIDGRFTARSGFPVTLNGRIVTDPSTGQVFYSGLNLVPTAPLYIGGAQYPGGRIINPKAFSLPAVGQYGDAPRDFARGFGATQLDLAFRRQFPLSKKLQGQFRAEAFNVLNHPNFGTINPYYGNVQFGQATATLAQSLGVLSPLYQMGGPRSLQLALKLTF